MTKKFFIFKKKFDLIFFRTFKPINPIDFDGKKIFKPNIFKKILYTLKDTTFKNLKWVVIFKSINFN